jgi:rRNA-processing protein FCF1
MLVPSLILLASLAGAVASIALPGHADFLLLAGPCAVASLVLLLIAFARRDSDRPNWILVDGSNVMHWRNKTAKIKTVRDVVDRLETLGLSPFVIFDANAGYLISNRYHHDDAMAARIGLPEDQVMVVPKGTVADECILLSARDLKANILTNDRYMDWAGQFPEVRRKGHLVRGGYRSDRLWLERIDGVEHASRD